MAEKKDTVWQSARVANAYLEGVRGAIPCAAEQIRIMLRLLETVPQGIGRFIDLGCGDGVLGAAVLARWPEAHGVFIDFSEEMICAARDRFEHSPNLSFLNCDYGAPGWKARLEQDEPCDAIVSAFSIHHQPDRRKLELYEEIFDLLVPGGFFINIEHVSPTSDFATELFAEHFIDSMYALEQEKSGTRTRDAVATEFYHRGDKEANILAPVEVQLDWLRQIGYSDVECHLRVFELALFAGRKPS